MATTAEAAREKLVTDADRERAEIFSQGWLGLFIGFDRCVALKEDLVAVFAEIRAEGEAKVRAEREACAEIALNLAKVGCAFEGGSMAEHIADVIRARQSP